LIFYEIPRLVICATVFVTIGLVLAEVEKLKKAFSWSPQSKRYAVHRKLFLIQVWFIPITVATISTVFEPPLTWYYMACLYITALQGFANVLATGEKKIILATRNLFRRYFCKQKRRMDTKLSHIDTMPAEGSPDLTPDSNHTDYNAEDMATASMVSVEPFNKFSHPRIPS